MCQIIDPVANVWTSYPPKAILDYTSFIPIENENIAESMTPDYFIFLIKRSEEESYSKGLKPTIPDDLREPRLL